MRRSRLESSNSGGNIVYTVTTFDQVVDGTTPIDSDPRQNEQYGIADKIAFQVYVSNSTGTSPDITLTYWHSNDGLSWVTHTTLLNAQSISATPYEVFADTGSAYLGKFGKVQLTLGGTTPTAYVRITACGRKD